MKTHGYCITINNPTEADWLVDADPTDADRYEELGIKRPKIFDSGNDFKEWYPVLNKHRVQFLIIGKERGKNGTYHFQIFVCFKRTASFNKVKKMWPRAHIEHTRGSFDQAREYCQKAGNYYEYGYDLDTCRDNIQRDIYLQSAAAEESDLRADVAALQTQQGQILERLDSNAKAIQELIETLKLVYSLS